MSWVPVGEYEVFLRIRDEEYFGFEFSGRSDADKTNVARGTSRRVVAIVKRDKLARRARPRLKYPL